jgi:hypothetical protein
MIPHTQGSDVIVPDDAVTDLTEQQLDEDISRYVVLTS